MLGGAPAGRRQQTVQLHAEDPLGNGDQHEDGQGGAQDGQEHDHIVGPLVLLQCGVDTQDQAQGHSHQRRVGVDQNGVGQLLQEDLEAGLTEVPVLIYTLDRDSAAVALVDSNLHREKILPSEKAFAYKMKLEAMNRQAGRPGKNNLTPVVSKYDGLRTSEKLAKEVGESRETIRRFIRLTELIPTILDMVDDNKIAMRPAVELSYLSKTEQEILLDTMQLEDCTPSHAQAIKMRKFSAEGRLNDDVILSILSEEKGNQKEQFRMPKERISKYFTPGTSAKQMEDTIVKALDMYRRRERSKER